MATDSGNAVAAEWVGPAGMQLFDGTVLNPGTIVVGVGKDEAEGSDYWKPLGDVESFADKADGDASSIRQDWSFGAEDGGEGTGRPLTEDQQAAQKTSRKKSGAASSSSDPAVASDASDSTEVAA